MFEMIFVASALIITGIVAGIVARNNDNNEYESAQAHKRWIEAEMMHNRNEIRELLHTIQEASRNVRNAESLLNRWELVKHTYKATPFRALAVARDSIGINKEDWAHALNDRRALIKANDQWANQLAKFA